jgi:penicillin-binding protein 1A
VSKKQVINVPNSTEKFTVNNYDNAYSGVSTLARATTFSDNAVYAQVGIKAGTKRVARTAQRMGIRTPVSSNYAITLGGLKQGVTPLDMAHAYQTFATGGVLVTGSLGAGRKGPVGIRRVTMRDDRKRVVDRNRARHEQVIPKAVAEATTGILESVIKVGTARVAGLGKVPAWGKTGTTENYGDAWFVGATEKFTVAVWVGYPNELRPMRSEYRGQPVAGGTYPAQIWHDFMLAVLQSEKDRLERHCTREEEKRKQNEPPSKRCIEAGLADDPTKTTPAPAATAPQTTVPSTTTPGDAAADGGTPAGEEAAPPADGETGAVAPQTPAAPPAPVTPPAAPAPVPVTPVPESGGATPVP